MKNFIQPGDSLDLTAPAGGVTSGQGYLIGDTLAVAVESKAAGEKFAGKVEGVFEMDKLTTDVMAEGVKVNWNNTNQEFQNATTDKDDAAVVVEAVGNGDTKVKVKLLQ